MCGALGAAVNRTALGPADKITLVIKRCKD